MKETKQEYLVIDFGRLGRMLLRRSWILALAAVLCAALTMGAGFFLTESRYESSVLFCAGNEPQGEGLSASDLDASGKLVDGFSVILYSRQTLVDVIAAAGAACSAQELEDRITIEQIGQTQFFRVTVTGADGVETVKISEAVGDVLPRRVAEITPGATATVVDPPVRTDEPAKSDLPIWGILGGILGLIFSVLLLVWADLRDDTIRSRDEVDNLSILATVTGKPEADKESFSLLRMKLNFCASRNGQICRVMGITGAVSPERKAEGATALAESLAQTGSRVLLVDCDMHDSKVADILGIPRNKDLFTTWWERQGYRGCSTNIVPKMGGRSSMRWQQVKWRLILRTCLAGRR